MRQAFVLLASVFLSLGCEQEVSRSQGVGEKAPEPPSGMVFIPGGSFVMGNERDLGTRAKFDEEKPAHPVSIDPFFMDVTEVTNAQFTEFVEATGYVTLAERGLSAEEFPNAPEDQLQPGAVIFTPPTRSLNPAGQSAWQWWTFVPGASWRNPGGPTTGIEDRLDHPVVCVSYEDARSYAEWAGKRLPTEAEWERAARGGLEQKLFTWGDRPVPDDAWQANVFQGEFPSKDTGLDGFVGTAPVRQFAPNGYGLYDMAGNVWELCSDFYSPLTYQNRSGTLAKNPNGPETGISQIDLDRFFNTGNLSSSRDTPAALALRSVRGGSFLCHHSYCLRYRPAARFHAEGLSPTNHIGFRCVKDLD